MVLKHFLSLGLLCALMGCGSQESDPPGPEKTFAELYPGRWRVDTPGSVLRTLASHRVRGCGFPVYRTRWDTPSEYLVYCSRDGQGNWSAYIVWPNIDAVEGPFATEPSVPPPKLGEL